MHVIQTIKCRATGGAGVGGADGVLVAQGLREGVVGVGGRVEDGGCTQTYPRPTLALPSSYPRPTGTTSISAASLEVIK